MTDVEVVGNKAFCAEAFGLSIVDVSDPANPFLISHLYYPGGPGTALKVISDRVYLAFGRSGIEIIDVADVGAPQALGHIPTPSWALDVAVEGTRVYWLDKTSGLHVADIQNPTYPIVLGSIDFGNDSLSALDVQNDVVFVVGAGKLRIVNAADGSNPTLIKTYLTPDDAVDVLVDSSYAYVADAASLEIIDITQLDSPFTVASVDSNTTVRNLARVGNYLYVDGYGLQIIDITDPTAPILRGQAVSSEHYYYYGIAATATHAFVIAGGFWDDAIHIENVMDPNAPFWVASYDSPGRPPRRVFAYDTIAYVVSQPSGLHLFNVANPGAPFWTGSMAGVGFLTHSFFTGVVSDGNLAFVQSQIVGYAAELVDVSDPANPDWLAGTWWLGSGASLALMEDTLLLVGRYGDLTIMDVDPLLGQSGLADVGVCSTGALDLVVSGDSAWVATGAGVALWEFSDPALPTRVSNLYLGNVSRIERIDSALFALDQSSKIWLVDVANPDSPYVRGTIATPRQGVEMAVQGGRLYVVDLDSGIQIWNVSNPWTPFAAGTYPIPSTTVYYRSSFRGISVYGDYVYVTSPGAGLLVLSPGGFSSRGDVNEDGVINSSDVIRLVNHIFKGGPPPLPVSSQGDVNCDGSLTAGDIIYLVNYIFKGGPSALCT